MAFQHTDRENRISGWRTTLLLFVALWALPAVASAATEAERYRLADELVQEALSREIYAMRDDRERLLCRAVELVPDHVQARSQMGQVQYNGDWVDADDVPEVPARQRQRRQYEERRAKTPDTAQGQLALANWCQNKRLTLQEQAHLNRVIQLAPENVEAHLRLGFRRTSEGWVRGDTIWQGLRDRLRISESIGRWKPVLDEIREGLDARSQRRRHAAEDQLGAIRDLSVIPALEVLWASTNRTLAQVTVKTLSDLPQHEASMALARIALFSPWPEIRREAALELNSRPMDGYVPALLAELSSPIQSRFLATMEGGRVLYRHAFFRERQDDNQLAVLDASLQRRVSYSFSPTGGADAPLRADVMPGLRQAADDVWQDDLMAVTMQLSETMRQREAMRGMQNAWIQQMNNRICSVLSIATEQKQPVTPQDWWQWWNEENEVTLGGPKYTNVNYLQDTQTLSYDMPEIETRRPPRHECFVAGTLVWTASGPVAIENVQIGDMVLSQHVNTGLLAYQAVLGTTRRPEEQLIKIRTETGEELECSGGHPFWVSGDGWIRARQLQAGMSLHGLRGAVHIADVQQGSTQETYNLIVAESQTYFVGEDRLLCHDNTNRRATNAVVPGLLED